MNDKVTVFKMMFFFGPQDRRKIGEKQIDDYVLDHYRKIFRQDLFDEHKEACRSLEFSVLNTREHCLNTIAEELWKALDLSEESFYSVADITSTGGEDPEDAEEDDEGGGPEKIRSIFTMTNLDTLVGMEDFKKLCADIVAISTSPGAECQQEFFSRCAILFSISGGDGFSRYISTLRQVLYLCDVRDIQGRTSKIREVKKDRPYEEMTSIIGESQMKGQMVAFDLTFKTVDAGTARFHEFMTEMRENGSEVLPVFKIPYMEGAEKERVLRAIREVYPLIVIDVPPFTTEQYAQFAVQLLSRTGYQVEDGARDELEELIIQKRNQKHFYGFRSVEMLTEDILVQKQRTEIRRRAMSQEVGFDLKDRKTIREEDLAPMLARCRQDQGGLEGLDEMIGIDEIRERVDEILAQLEVSSRMPADQKPCMHMLFTGNPGTGKTTVARLLGKVLKERNVLSKGQFFERSGREFVGKYIGETAPITNAICRDAYGSVLFIDEAYTLYRNNDERDFGKEALDTLLTQMENHRQDFIVIFSGYSDRMKEMLEANPGLKSRIPHEIKFRNFTRDELYRIFMSMATKTYQVKDDLADAAKEYFMALSQEVLESESFSNARFVRNLYERTAAKAALRVQAQLGGRPLDASLITLTADDFRKAESAEEFKELLQKKTRLGFV